MKTSDFNYQLPEELIAQTPLERRDGSRLMTLDRNTGAWEHHHFRDILDEIRPGDVFVFNNTKVIPARLYGKKRETGGKVEMAARYGLTDEEIAFIESMIKPRELGGDGDE